MSMSFKYFIVPVSLASFSMPPNISWAQSPADSPSNRMASQDSSELEMWLKAEQSGSANGYEAYLRRHPNGAFASLARSRSVPSLLQDMMPVAPEPDNYEVQVEMAAARKAWDEAAWARVKAANNHSAYREYLLHLPNGIYQTEATLAYSSSLPAVPSIKLPDCTIASEGAAVTRRFNSRDAFPSSTTVTWTDGIIIGVNQIDYTGAPLGLSISYASNPSMFNEGARKQAGKMFYNPRVTNCARVADVSPMIISYIDGELPYESRANSDGPPLQARVGNRLVGDLPGDRAILIQFAPSPGLSVYEIDFDSRFPPLLTQVVEGRARPIPLVNNKMFVSINQPSITLRVSSRDKPNSRVQNKGRFRMHIRQVFSQNSL